jgi:hypothetical protein
MTQVSCLVPTGHLSYAPMEPASFYAGLKEQPGAIIADAGSCDIGPYPLGAGSCASPEEWQRFDLDHMLRGARQLQIPMLVSSCNDTGTNQGVDKFVRIIKDIAAQHRLAPFRLASIRYILDKAFVHNALRQGRSVKGLDGRPDLTLEVLERTDNLVPVMGAEPFVQALNLGAEVIVASRASDCCPFAGFALSRGIPKDVAYYWGKVLECASFACEPYMGKESILGTAFPERVLVKAMHPEQRCTPASVAGHAMYERNDPYREAVAGGEIDMTNVVYTQVDDKTTEVRGMRFREAAEYWVKLEGAGKVGERCYIVVGVRDPQTIANIDRAIDWARGKVEAWYGPIGGAYQLYYHVYGKNGVLGELEPVREIRSHELGIVVEAIAETLERAEKIVTLAARGIFYARLPTKGTAGGGAFLTEDVLVGKPAYEWTLNHIIQVDDPLQFFPITLETVGAA